METDEKCNTGAKRKPKKAAQANVFGVGEVETVRAGAYPEVPKMEIPDHLKPSFMRPREIDQIQQP